MPDPQLLLAIDPESGDWRMPYDDSEPVYRVRIEKAKSGRAKCRMCGEMIKTGCWRIGVPIKWRTFISTWHHPPCFFIKDDPIQVDKGEVFGWEEIEDPTDLVELGKELSKSETPAHLGGEIDVVDESFLSGDIAPKKLKRDFPRLVAPHEMTVTLLPFQEEGHAWLLDREQHSPEKGGILADEMGLGKTIQTIALLVSAKKLDGKSGGPTLIVAPSSAMLQWQDEITRCTLEDTLSVLVYQSAKRKRLTPQDILGVDVILTSYPILEMEYRQAMNAQKVVCVYCGRKFLARKLIPHHKYFCGPEAQRTARLEKTERSRHHSTQKAMQTLRIGTSSAPTPTAIYRDLMIEAGRTPSSMLTSAEEARANDSGQSSASQKTPKTPASKMIASSSVTPSSSSKKKKPALASFIVDDDEDVFEEEKTKNTASGDKKKKKSVYFSPETGKEDNTSSRKRQSAIKAQQSLSEIRKSESKNGDSPVSPVWYGEGVGLFWRINGSIWRSPSGSLRQLSAEGRTVVLERNDMLYRLSSDALETSKNGGQTWSMLAEKSRNPFWVSTELDDEEEDDTLHVTGKYIGRAVVRRFEKKDVVGLVFARFDETKLGDPALWRVRHVDGDVEDLEAEEVVEAMTRAEEKKLSLEWLKPTPTQSTSAKKKGKPIVVDESDEDDDDSSFLAEEEDEDEDEDDDDDSDEVEILDDEDDDEVEFVSATTTTKTKAFEGPRFVPQSWGPDEAPSEWSSRLSREEKKKPKSKKKKKPALSSKSAGVKGMDDEPSSSSSSESEGDDDDEPVGDVKYAPDGDVVDDDLVDLNRSLLHCIAWHRIILDEAHKIKERTNSTAKAVFALRGNLTHEGPSFPKPEQFGIEEEPVKTTPVKKDPSAPKKPKSAFQFYVDAKTPAGKLANPGLSAKDLRKTISQQWKELSEDKRSKFAKQAENDRDRYKKEMQAYESKRSENGEKEVSEADSDGEDQVPKSKKKQKTSSTKGSVKETPKEAKGDSKSKGNGVHKDDKADEHSCSEGGSGPVLFDDCRRWALTGTPLMNRLGDLYSLVRFIRVSPYSYYFCKKGCDCRLLQWSFGWDARFCTHCGHTPMSHYSFFNKTIMNPVNRNGYVGAGRRAMLLLRDELLGNIMLRRTKVERKDDLNLPPLTVLTTEIELTVEERDFYESIYKLSQSKFDTFVAKGTIMNNYAHVFQLLSRLRQAADHPYLIVASADALPSRAAGNSDICRICMMNVDDIGNLAVAKCRHTFHRECVEKYIEDFEEAQNAKEEETLDKDGKPKKTKKGGKGKKKKDGDDDANEGIKAMPKCPSCHVPLTVTLRVHGGGEEKHHHESQENGAGSSAADGGVEESSCVICFDRPRTALLMPCGHAYMCMECANGLENRTCPVCRTKIEKIMRITDGKDNYTTEDGASSSKKAKKNPLFGRKSILQKLKLEQFSSSSKLDAIVHEVRKINESLNRATEKIIVFSQFTTFLDIIQWRLESLKISGVVKLVGSLSVEERRAVLKAFKTDPKINVILMSLKAGGEGLNLQEATVVLSCDPWWNPSVELQAFHRAHRIGQTRPVKAIRFVTKNTIEERMVELQQKKSLIFEGTVEGNEGSLAKLTQEDLRFLFQR